MDIARMTVLQFTRQQRSSPLSANTKTKSPPRLRHDGPPPIHRLPKPNRRPHKKALSTYPAGELRNWLAWKLTMNEVRLKDVEGFGPPDCRPPLLHQPAPHREFGDRA